MSGGFTGHPRLGLSDDPSDYEDEEEMEERIEDLIESYVGATPTDGDLIVGVKNHQVRVWRMESGERQLVAYSDTQGGNRYFSQVSPSTSTIAPDFTEAQAVRRGRASDLLAHYAPELFQGAGKVWVEGKDCDCGCGSCDGDDDDDLEEAADPFSWGTSYNALVAQFKAEAQDKPKERLKAALKDILDRDKSNQALDKKLIAQWNKEKKAYGLLMQHHGPDHAIAVARHSDLTDKVNTQMQRMAWASERMKNIQKLLDNLDSVLAEDSQLPALLGEAFNKGTYLPLNEFPDKMRQAINSAGFKKRDIEVITSKTFPAPVPAFEGNRTFVVAIEMTTGKTNAVKGSYAAAMGERGTEKLDYARGDAEIRPGYAVLVGESGGRGMFARLYVHPDNMAKLLPSGDDEELSLMDKKVLYIVRAHNSRGRQEEWWRNKMPGEYGGSNELILDLQRRGYFKVTSSGAVSMTTKGKNAAKDLRWSIMHEDADHRTLHVIEIGTGRYASVDAVVVEGRAHLDGRTWPIQGDGAVMMDRASFRRLKV